MLMCVLTVQVSAQEAVTWDGTFRRVRVPVLRYAQIDDESPNGITLEALQTHLDFLFFQGYTPITMYTLHEALMVGQALPPKPVALTFDGGFRAHYTQVFPALRDHSFTATFFIPTSLTDANDPNHVTWEQVAEMAANGMRIESYAKTAPDLRGADYSTLVYELLGSVESIAAYTGIPPRMLAYPEGAYNANVIEVVEAIPFWRAFTLEEGVNHTTDRCCDLPRLTITRDTSIQRLNALLSQH